MTVETQKTIAVFFGGRSVEHDVSVLTALQFIEAMNPLKYKAMPVYVDPLGQFWGGEPLLNRDNYPIDAEKLSLTALSLDIVSAQAGTPKFTSKVKKFFGEEIIDHPFDLAVPAIHGSNGEDGSLQGLFEFASIPYAGCRTLAAASTMDKAFAKKVLRASGVKVLEDIVIPRPAKGKFLSDEELSAAMGPLGDNPFPVIVKPCNLGSSVGVSKADNADDLMAALLTVFRMDHAAIIEPFVDNLTEYNVAVRRDISGGIVTSAIEEPKRDSDLLDFKTKYMSGSKGGKKMPAKTGGAASEGMASQGMASLGRVLNPESLNADQMTEVTKAAIKAFTALDLAGSVRIDFLCNAATGEIWMNEINTIPGSFAFFLWEAASVPISFLDLTSAIIEEGFILSKGRGGQTSTAQGKASIFS